MKLSSPTLISIPKLTNIPFELTDWRLAYFTLQRKTGRPHKADDEDFDEVMWRGRF